MDFKHHALLFALREKIRPFLSTLQGANLKAQPNSSLFSTVRGLSLLFLVLILSWVANHASETRSIRTFRATYWIDTSIWKAYLRFEGFELRPKITSYAKLLEKNPASFSDNSEIWITQTGAAVLIPKSPYQIGPELWTLSPNPDSSAPEWINLGSGLMGLENLRHFLEKIPKKINKPQLKQVKWIDPKEIHY